MGFEVDLYRIPVRQETIEVCERYELNPYRLLSSGCVLAAADNGVLQQITPRFTTIDGIACVSFIPPHFSPYVIYVDTNNLIAGQMLDATPATGDPIHPKWFAAIGMACVSILLFVLSDGRKRKNYRAA